MENSAADEGQYIIVTSMAMGYVYVDAWVVMEIIQKNRMLVTEERHGYIFTKPFYCDFRLRR